MDGKVEEAVSTTDSTREEILLQEDITSEEKELRKIASKEREATLIERGPWGTVLCMSIIYIFVPAATVPW